MTAKELYDSYPLPDGGVDLEDDEHADAVLDASALLLAYNTDAKTLRTALDYLTSVLQGTAEESPLLYRDIGRMRGGWHAAPGGGFQSREFRFSGYDMRWHVERRQADAMATAVCVRNYDNPRPSGLGAVAEEDEEKVTSPARTSAPPPPPLVNAENYARFLGLHNRHVVAKAPPVAAGKVQPPTGGTDKELARYLGHDVCNMRIADLLLNTHEPGYESAARKCAACGRAVAVHDQ